MKTESIFRIGNHEAPNAAPVQETLSRRVAAVWRHIVRIAQRPPRRLRLCENLPLGDRRFVAVVEYEEARFLVGGTSASLVLLARLDTGPTTHLSSGASAPTQALNDEVRG